MPVPISLIIDDSCPLVHVYACHYRDVHGEELMTQYGAEMPLYIENDFLSRYCDVVERHGMAGKFSIVPAPGGIGDIVQGIEGRPLSQVREWIDTMNTRLGPRWSFCSEGITHNLAVNLEAGGYFAESEHAWSQHQDRSTLTPYLIRQLELCRDAGIDCTGVTSPWAFGRDVEDEYVAAIVAAQAAVYGRSYSWYFLHMTHRDPARMPWIAYQDDDATLVHIPGNLNDFFWETIHSPRTDAGWARAIADNLLTEDGQGGAIREVLDAGGWPILVTHWQSLFSNGLETGLAALDVVGERIDRHLAGDVEWRSFDEIARLVVPE